MAKDKKVPTARKRDLARVRQAFRQKAKARSCSSVCVTTPNLDIALDVLEREWPPRSDHQSLVDRWFYALTHAFCIARG
jgi:hypothetical protein